MDTQNEKKLFLVDTDIFGTDPEYDRKIISFLLGAQHCDEFDIAFVGDKAKLTEAPDSLNTSTDRGWSDFADRRIDILLSNNSDLKKLYPKYQLGSGSPYISGHGFEYFIESFEDHFDFGIMEQFHDHVDNVLEQREADVAMLIKNQDQAFKACLQKQPVSSLIEQFQASAPVYIYSQGNLTGDLLFIFQGAALGEQREIKGQTQNILRQTQKDYGNGVSQKHILEAIEVVRHAALNAERNEHNLH